MKLIMISCTPRVTKNSNTDKILRKFRDGFEDSYHTSLTYYLYDEERWPEIRKAFYENDNILFALPLYVECIPGIMMEFLETLHPKSYPQGKSRTKISFLVQGGFAEASQLRCCERYLETVPQMLNCDYNGTLIKGGMFGVSLVNSKERERETDPFIEMGRIFSTEGRFDKAKVSEFAKPEYFSKSVLMFFNVLNIFQNKIFRDFAKQLGCKEPLDAKPYEIYVKHS